MLWPNPLWDKGAADGLKHAPAPHRVTVPNFVALCETVWAQIGSQKFGHGWAPPLGMGTWLTPYKYASPHLYYHAKFGYSKL